MVVNELKDAGDGLDLQTNGPPFASKSASGDAHSAPPGDTNALESRRHEECHCRTEKREGLVKLVRFKLKGAI